MTARYLPDVRIAERAIGLLSRYESDFGAVTGPPVPVEDIADGLLDLRLLWDSVSESASTTVLAGLEPQKRMIKFNESRRQVFDETQGLYNTVLGHEIATGSCTLTMNCQPKSNCRTSSEFTSAYTRNPLALVAPKKRRPTGLWAFFSCLPTYCGKPSATLNLPVGPTCTG